MVIFTYFLWVLSFYYAHAGPEPSPFPYCTKTFSALHRNERQSLRRAVVAVQGLTSQLALHKFGAHTSQASGDQLQEWLESNKTVVSKLDRSGLALTCLGHRRHRLALGRPVFSFLLEYFKRPKAIHRIASSLHSVCVGAGIPCELVVNADNPHEADQWTAAVNATAGFVVPVFSANVHEARGYNRAARAAQGRYLIIWQDDQLPPREWDWLHDLLRLFAAYPQLAILGMNTYRLCRHAEPTNRFGPTPWDPDPRTGVRWSYVQNVDFAPLVIRASAYEALGGLEEGFTRSGDCGIWGDWELCNRAWLGGWQVGFLHLKGRTGDGEEGGTHVGSNAEKCWGRQQFVTSAGFGKRYGVDAFQDELCGAVWRLNVDSFGLSDPAACPYGPAGETKFGNCSRPAG